MIIKSYQEQRGLLAEPLAPVEIAVVGSVHADGIALIFPGETLESRKHYAYNAAASFSPGQRVHLARVAGTYIVEYPIGGQTQ